MEAMPMRRLTLFAVALAAMVFPSLSLADPPEQELLPNEPFLIDEGSCGFPVQVEPSGGRFKLLTFSNGDQIISGRYVATVTNLDNGTSTHINLSGQGMFDASTGVFVSNGGTILIDPGSLLYVHGPIVFDASGGRTIISASVRDMCAVLSGP
jgi:hypothetical protein